MATEGDNSLDQDVELSLFEYARQHGLAIPLPDIDLCSDLPPFEFSSSSSATVSKPPNQQSVEAWIFPEKLQVSRKTFLYLSAVLNFGKESPIAARLQLVQQLAALRIELPLLKTDPDVAKMSLRRSKDTPWLKEQLVPAWKIDSPHRVNSEHVGAKAQEAQVESITEELDLTQRDTEYLNSALGSPDINDRLRCPKTVSVVCSITPGRSSPALTNTEGLRFITCMHPSRRS
jgi:hypothetical protein